ncbi:unnamed protein product [Lactuca saligna]|uniref:Uncharacterized protein n=1 Tax=Lactuca saligna TaxID=75948 RepID=A0AA35ZPQ7_LACSI|nr:unnamed protein product [Lactuca saligna]
MKGSKFSNTFEEAINLDDDDFLNIHSGESSVSVNKKNKWKDEIYEDIEADLDVNVRRSGRKKSKVIKKNEVLKETDNKKGMKKRKSKRNNLVENEDVVVEDDRSKELHKISCRMSPKSIYMAVKGMSYSQKEMVRRMGFGAFLDIKLDSVSSRLDYYLVEKFRAKTSTIKTNKGEILITKKTVEEMFGLPSEGLDYNQLVECDKTETIIEAWKSQYPRGRFNNGNYVKRIRQSDVADDMFKLNFLTLFRNTFAETEMSGASHINCLEKLARYEDIQNIDRCKYIVECLEKAKYKWRPNDANCYYTGPITLLLTDKVVLNGYNLRRSRPLITQIDSVDLEMLEEHGLRMGKFGTLEFRGDGEVDLVDVNGDEDKLGWNQLKCYIVGSVMIRKKTEEAIMKGLEDDPNDDVVKEWSIKVRQLFNEKTVELGDTSLPTNEVAMKTPGKVAVNSKQNNFVKGSSMICQVQSTGRNNEKTKVVDGFNSPFVLFLEYKGNTSLDSPVVLTPGLLNMSDEIVERSIRKKKEFYKDDIPSFDLRITQLNEKEKNEFDKEESKAVIRYTKKFVTEDKPKKITIKDSMESEMVHAIDFKNGKDVDEVVKDDENVVAEIIIAWGKDNGEIIWETIERHGMHLEAARTLAMRTKVHTNTYYMVNEDVEEELRYNKVRIMFVGMINDISDNP